MDAKDRIFTTSAIYALAGILGDKQAGDEAIALTINNLDLYAALQDGQVSGILTDVEYSHPNADARPDSAAPTASSTTDDDDDDDDDDTDVGCEAPSELADRRTKIRGHLIKAEYRAREGKREEAFSAIKLALDGIGEYVTEGLGLAGTYTTVASVAGTPIP